MDSSKPNRTFSLVQREIQEYKNSLVWTPVAIAIGLTVVMLLSVILANRITVMGDAMMKVMLEKSNASGMAITIQMDEGNGPASDEFVISEKSTTEDVEDWNFSKKWKFSPDTGGSKLESNNDSGIDSFNPMLNVLHSFMILVLMLVTVNYLLGSLYNDRKDRSILFWKSMPVSEWEEVLAKLGVALVVAPVIFIGLSILTQFAFVLMAMLMVWRMDMNAFEVILGNIEFAPLLMGQISGWLLTMLWLAPFYAWLMLASAGAKRSPFMLAAAPVLALVALENIFLGSDYVSNAVSNHLPHYVDDHSAVAFYFHGPSWGTANYMNIGRGLLFCVAALWACVYLRRYRFEI